jgi:hypothetical protein
MGDTREKLRDALFGAMAADRGVQETSDAMVDAALGVLDEENGRYAEELRVARARAGAAEKERDECMAGLEEVRKELDAGNVPANHSTIRRVRKLAQQRDQAERALAEASIEYARNHAALDESYVADKESVAERIRLLTKERDDALTMRDKEANGGDKLDARLEAVRAALDAGHASARAYDPLHGLWQTLTLAERVEKLVVARDEALGLVDRFRMERDLTQAECKQVRARSERVYIMLKQRTKQCLQLEEERDDARESLKELQAKVDARACGEAHSHYVDEAERIDRLRTLLAAHQNSSIDAWASECDGMEEEVSESAARRDGAREGIVAIFEDVLSELGALDDVAKLSVAERVALLARRDTWLQTQMTVVELPEDAKIEAVEEQ